VFIDVHTHNPIPNKNSITNVILGKDTMPKHGWFSLGVHPWYIEGFEDSLIDLEKTLTQGNSSLVFIGECGLDNFVAVDYKVQEIIFKAQIALAEKYKKPLIIHCVKAHNELIKIKKEVNSAQPWVIHGFNRKQTIAGTLIKEGFYLSFGREYLRTSIGREVLRQTPIEKLFLETDDDHAINIEEVYHLAGEILGVELEQLKTQIKNNLWKVTGWKEQN
jgi:TatD DNase family protein